MANFFSSLFSSGKKEATTEGLQKDELKNFDILKYDGIRAMRIRQIPYAIKCFREALHIQQDFETMSHLVSAYTMAGDPESALEVVDEMIDLEPEHVNTLLTRVNIFFLLDRDGEAIADCDRVIALEEENHLAWFLRAKAKRTINEWEGAIADLTQAIALKEDMADAYLVRARILLEKKEGEKALADVEKVISLVEEGDETAHLLRGQIYELLGDQAAAEAEYEEVLALNPFCEEAYVLAGRLKVAQGKPQEALEILDEAVEHNEEYAPAYAERARIRQLLGDTEGAEKDRQAALDLAPDEEKASPGGQANFDDLYKGGIF